MKYIVNHIKINWLYLYIFPFISIKNIVSISGLKISASVTVLCQRQCNITITLVTSVSS